MHVVPRRDWRQDELRVQQLRACVQRREDGGGGRLDRAAGDGGRRRHQSSITAGHTTVASPLLVFLPVEQLARDLPPQVPGEE
jgi:hypothetical protein